MRKNQENFTVIPSPRSFKNLFLIATCDHQLPRPCKVFMICTVADAEDNKTRQTENIVEPIEVFDDKPFLIKAKMLNDMVDIVAFVRVLNSSLQHRQVFRNARITCG